MKSYAKINLALDILGKDDTGYHNIQTVLTEIPLFDEIEIEEADKNSVEFAGKEAHLISDENNTVMKALKFGKKKYHVLIKKNIPLGAGLGGGSSNAAAILKFIGAEDKAAEIGMDVPFFINGGTGLGTHYGEKMQALPDMNWDGMSRILVIPQLRKSTKNMYEKVNLDECGKNAEQIKILIRALDKGDIKTVLNNAHNDFENYAGGGFAEIKAKLTQNGAEYVMLCGSGTGIFAVSSNSFDLKVLSQELQHQHILNLNP